MRPNLPPAPAWTLRAIWPWVLCWIALSVALWAGFGWLVRVL